MSLAVYVARLTHIGIRVHDLARSRKFYELLGFKFTWGPFGPEQVAAMEHRSGLEINLIVNAPGSSCPNVLMDVAAKHAGITHIALKTTDLDATEEALSAAGIQVTGKRGAAPVKALFIRDPDRNVIELAAD